VALFISFPCFFFRPAWPRVERSVVIGLPSPTSLSFRCSFDYCLPLSGRRTSSLFLFFSFFLSEGSLYAFFPLTSVRSLVSPPPELFFFLTSCSCSLLSYNLMAISASFFFAHPQLRHPDSGYFFHGFRFCFPTFFVLLLLALPLPRASFFLTLFPLVPLSPSYVLFLLCLVFFSTPPAFSHLSCCIVDLDGKHPNFSPPLFFLTFWYRLFPTGCRIEDGFPFFCFFFPWVF